MKINICDICASEGTTSEAWGKRKMKQAGSSVSIDICEGHKGGEKFSNFDDFMKYAQDLNQKYWDLKLKNVNPVVVELKTKE